MVDYQKGLGRALVVWRWIVFIVVALDLTRGATIYGGLSGAGSTLKMVAADGTSPTVMVFVLGAWSAVASFLILTVRSSAVPAAVAVVDAILGAVFMLTQKSLFCALLLGLPVVGLAPMGIAVALGTAVAMALIDVVLVVMRTGDAANVISPLVAWSFAYLGLAALGASFYDFFLRQHRQTQTLVSVVETNQELGSSASEEKILAVVAQNVQKLFHCSSCVIYLRDADSDKESVVRAAHSSTSAPDAFADFNYDIKRSIIGQSIKQRKAQVVADFHALPDEEAIRRDASMRAVMVAPLLFEEQALGAIFVAAPAPGAYDESQLRLFTLLANQAALAVRNLQLHKTTATLAVTDSLSGLYTHGYFQEHLAKEVVQNRNSTRDPLSLMIIDVDFFKKVNDNYGHPQGDALLKQLGALIKEVARPSDVLCRYGGDEFTITMPRTNRIGAVVIAERLREMVENYEFVLGTQIVHITVSGGVASFPEDADTPKELVEKADRAMYEAKEKGRNRVCFSA